ncbi:unnamed protein product [Alopecurus aequalis]
MSGQTSDSQSSDGGGNNPVPIVLNMHTAGLTTKPGLGSFTLEMPSAEPFNRTKKEEYPAVLLEIRDNDQVACLSRMKQLQHENILKLHFFDDASVGSGNAPSIRAYTEMYTGLVSDLFIPQFLVNPDTRLVPSQEFQEMVISSLYGLINIFENNLYHGNFSWNTTLYHQDKNDGKRTLKLSNFEMIKNKSVLECQIADVHALGHALEEVSEFMQFHYPNWTENTCVLIDDLAISLAVVTATSLSNLLRKIKEEIEDHVFFWDGKRKKSFYAYEIPQVWDNENFLQIFRGSQSNPALPWHSFWKTDIFMEEMKNYRSEMGIREYNVYSLKDFIRFISGMYTHQEDIKKKFPHRSVDGTVHSKHPRLLLDLKAGKAAIDEADDMDLDDE